jgi:monofunctional biosynthetic peptidoglycan transglycosylase
MVATLSLGLVFVRGLQRLMRWLFWLCTGLVALFLGLIALWRFEPPVSTLMIGRYASLRPVERRFVPLTQISPYLQAAAVTSEDAQFCRHRGVDWGALREVLSDRDGPSRGASTIPMQLAKNLFLWPSRSVLRKGLEIPMALALDLSWDKRRILEAYLNVAEWGDGLFGAEAAARYYFGKAAAALTPAEAALLAAALPNPILRNPARPSTGHRRLAQRLQARIARFGDHLACLRTG